MNLKEVFVQRPEARVIADALANPQFEHGLIYAMENLRRHLPSDPEAAASNWHKIQGAEAFIACLYDLVSVPTPRMLNLGMLPSMRKQ